MSKAGPFSTVLDTNPLAGAYELGKFIGFAGPENAWKIHEAVRRQDGKVIPIVPSISN